MTHVLLLGRSIQKENERYGEHRQESIQPSYGLEIYAVKKESKRKVCVLRQRMQMQLHTLSDPRESDKGLSDMVDIAFESGRKEVGLE